MAPPRYRGRPRSREPTMALRRSLPGSILPVRQQSQRRPTGPGSYRARDLLPAGSRPGTGRRGGERCRPVRVTVRATVRGPAADLRPDSEDQPFGAECRTPCPGEPTRVPSARLPWPGRVGTPQPRPDTSQTTGLPRTPPAGIERFRAGAAPGPWPRRPRFAGSGPGPAAPRAPRARQSGVGVSAGAARHRLSRRPVPVRHPAAPNQPRGPGGSL